MTGWQGENVRNVMNVMNEECGNVKMWKCENESRICGFKRIARILQMNIDYC